MAVDAKICSVIKATSNTFISKWICPPSKVGSDKKQLAPPGTVQLDSILQAITIAISPEGMLSLPKREVMDLDWRSLSRTPFEYWTDQVTRPEMMKLIIENFTPPPVNTQGSLAWK